MSSTGSVPLPPARLSGGSATVPGARPAKDARPQASRPLADRLWPAYLRFDPLGVVGLVIVILAWWLFAWLEVVPRIFMPSPGEVATIIRENFFASDYLANYYLGNGGFLASLTYTVTN